MKINFLSHFKKRILTQLLFSVGLIIIGNGLISCNSELEQKKKIDYLKYTATINQAESFILDSNYTDALEKYKEAINNVDIPIASHCFTAMQVSASLDSLQSFKKFTNHAMKCGLGESHFKRDSLLKDYISTKRLEAFIEENHAVYHNEYLERINQPLDDTLIKLAQWDSKWKNYYLVTMSRKHPENKKLYDKKYDSIVSHIVDDYLIPLIKKDGYPGERKIGFGRTGRPDSYNYSYNSITTRNLLMHYFMEPKSCIYNDLFFEEVKKGNMSSSEYAILMDFQARNGADTICENFKIYNEHFIIKDSTRFKEFNINRAEIGLGTIEELNQKYERGKRVCRENKRKQKYNQIKLFYWCG